MFTGIVLGQGTLKRKGARGKGMFFCLEAGFDLSDPLEGESIAVNGVCLTATAIRGRVFDVDLSPETLSRTSLGNVGIGETVNLERALRLSDRLGGHLVSGHVDGVAQVLQRVPEGDFTRFVFGIPPGLGRYIVKKGSVALDGVSLTVNSCDDTSFSVAVIPHTLEVTAMGRLRPGSTVNLEVDLIGKYVEKLLTIKSDAAPAVDGITSAFLAEHGFLK